MDKKNNLLLTIIAIATLLVAVVGATFAYFASGSVIQNKVVNVTTGSAASFTATVERDLNITADAANMANTAELAGHWTNETNTNVTFKLAGDPGAYCVYSLKYTQDAGSATYEPTVGDGANQLGGGLSFITTSTGIDATNNAANGKTTTVKWGTATDYATAIASAGDNGYVVNQGVIKVPADDADRLVEYTINVKLIWQNLETNQLANAGKTFAGKLEVQDVACYAPDNTPLNGSAS